MTLHSMIAAPLRTAPMSETRTMVRVVGHELPDDGGAHLAPMMREIARQLNAEEVLVAWHDGDSAPTLLFADGGEQPRSAAERAMIQTAAQAARANQLAPIDGREPDDAATGGLVTASMRACGGVVTITARPGPTTAMTRAQVREAAAGLMPFLQPFFWLWGLRRRLMARLSGMTAAINNADLGILLIDDRGRLLFANAAADTLLAAGDGVRQNGGLLSGSRLADTVRLRAAIEHVLDRPDDAAGAMAPVVALHRGDKRPLLAAVVPAEPAQPAGSGDVAAVLYLVDPDQNLGPLIEPACKLYGLSPVETRLTCQLAQGVSLADAATAIRVREQTARSYLKQIFQKTQTNRQAELVWLMLKSAVRTAPACRTSFV